MRTPVRPLPPSVARWATWARVLRWLDAASGATTLWAIVAAGVPGRTASADLAIALLVFGVAACLAPLRRRWRPVSAIVGIVVSRDLKPGDRAWYARPDGVERVLVTARGVNRIVIATGRPGAAEGITVRRTRVLLVPAG